LRHRWGNKLFRSAISDLIPKDFANDHDNLTPASADGHLPAGQQINPRALASAGRGRWRTCDCRTLADTLRNGYGDSVTRWSGCVGAGVGSRGSAIWKRRRRHAILGGHSERGWNRRV